MPELYSRQEVEAALSDLDYRFLSENDGQALYVKQGVSQSCLDDIVIDWYKNEASWEDLERQIKDQHLDAEPLHRGLTDNREG